MIPRIFPTSRLTPEPSALDRTITTSSRQKTEPTPSRAYAPRSFLFFSSHAIQEDTQPGQAYRIQTIETTKQKFQISTSSWDGIIISIPQESHSSFSESSEEAKDLLHRLTQLQKPGTLILRSRTNQDTTLQYKRFWRTPRQEQQEKTKQYVMALLEQAYPHDSEELKSYFERSFNSYLLNPKRSEEIGNNFGKYFEKLLAPYDPLIQSQLESSALSSAIEPISKNPIEHLSHKGFVVHKNILLGKGSSGSVYAANIGAKAYVYKEQRKNNFLTDEFEQRGKWWRIGDIAASRLKDLPHFAKSLAFILEITNSRNVTKKYYVPLEQVKILGEKLLSEAPKVEVRLIAQLMEKAPGHTLQELLLDYRTHFNGADYFDSIVIQLFSFLEKTYNRNLIHRDLKSSNLMFDADKNSPTYNQLTVIDCGIGGVYGKRHKMSPKRNKTLSHNRLYSTKKHGAFYTMAPAVYFHESYGSEVDFYSAGVVLIELLDGHGFNAALNRLEDRKSFFTYPRRTRDFLNTFGPESRMAKILEANPYMKTTIDLFFYVAAVSEDTRNQAFEHLKNFIATDIKPRFETQKKLASPQNLVNTTEPLL